MADKRIYELPAAATLDTAAFLATDDSVNGTKKLQISALLSSGDYEQKGNVLLFEIPNYTGLDTKVNLDIEVTIKSQATQFSILALGFGEERVITFLDNPLVIAMLSDLIYEEDNKKYGQLYMFAPKTTTLTATIESSEICSDIRMATLAAGATTVTFTNIPTSGNNLIEIYTSKAGLDYTAVDDTTAGQLTYTFDAQSAAVTCYLMIREV